MTSVQQIYEVGQFIDTNALGYSARVARATHWVSGQDVAFKVLRLWWITVMSPMWNTKFLRVGKSVAAMVN
ncbi:MAG: hypothetical protein HZC38_16550 [Chloroflexi bacterium]|nr:hypothetical protein [Chloroflexota bacterium]